MPGFATLRLTWEPRMLSMLRIVVGLLYMEHGLAKVLGFPLQPNHAPYRRVDVPMIFAQWQKGVPITVFPTNLALATAVWPSV